ncbi:hypothetical protein CCR75_008075 [Bremia lactucae]|uniref:Uncharacterized protein n=1 Tax=Bremia lactucae TaxID=4779 RepID=A0A976ILD1_BRELC|nr:hypothetical protein CCR75_008075 [Bremia lactucae]
MEAPTTLPQLDEAIAFLQADITALRSEKNDANLVAQAVAVAAGELPLPEPQFAPLLALWKPSTSSFATEFAALVDQFNAAQRREQEDLIKTTEMIASLPIVHSALQRVRGQRTRPRTRPRRRFEDPDVGHTSPLASDGTASSHAEIDRKEENSNAAVETISAHDVAKEASQEEHRGTVIEQSKAERNPEKEEAEAALAGLQALRQSMLLDVLSKIVSVAKSKDVDPAMFSKQPCSDQKKQHDDVDLATIRARVVCGDIGEWSEFAEHVYGFCQHVVTYAEAREQQEARRKGVELLHFARTLTETLRQASVKKESVLLQKIQAAEDNATNRKEPHTLVQDETAAKDTPLMKTDELLTSNGLILANDSTLCIPLHMNTPLQPSRRTRKRSRKLQIEPCSGDMAQLSPTSFKRVDGPSISAAYASDDVSASDSHDASASEADWKSRGRGKAFHAKAKRIGSTRRRPTVPATRASSRQLKRRAAAAAAAVNESGDDDGDSALDDGLQGFEEHEGTGEEDKRKKGAVKARGRKKNSRKR